MAIEGKPQRGFFISQIGKEGSPERMRADDVFDYIVFPVAKEFDIDVIRADRDRLQDRLQHR